MPTKMRKFDEQMQRLKETIAYSVLDQEHGENIRGRRPQLRSGESLSDFYRRLQKDRRPKKLAKASSPKADAGARQSRFSYLKAFIRRLFSRS